MGRIKMNKKITYTTYRNYKEPFDNFDLQQIARQLSNDLNKEIQIISSPSADGEELLFIVETN